MTDDTLILHIYADDGVESEALKTWGRVVRLGIDPRESPYSEVIQADATAAPIKDGVADLACLHPPCGPWASAPSSYDQERADHPDLIDDARSLARRVADDYIIENVPQAPLDDPVVLNGRMFGLTVHHERGFETSFSVPDPPQEDDSAEMVYWWNDYSTYSKQWWAAAKGYTGTYRKDPLVKAATPRAYIDFLLRAWDE